METKECKTRPLPLTCPSTSSPSSSSTATGTSPRSSASSKAELSRLTIEAAAQGNTEAQQKILELEERIVRIAARPGVPGWPQEDLRQELRLYLITKVVRTFPREADPANFPRWANRCLAYRRLTLVKLARGRAAMQVLKAVTRLDDDTDPLAHMRSGTPTPLTLAIRREAIEQAAADIFDNASPTAKAAALLVAAGLTRTEASQVLSDRGVAAVGSKALSTVAKRLGYAKSTHGQVPIEVIREGEVIGTYPSQAAAAEATGVPFTQISPVVNGHRKSAQGLIFKRVAGATA